MPPQRSRAFPIFAWCVVAYSVLVVLWGAYVRATGSGAGCGNHWPLCNGEVMPRTTTVAMMIEFTHRLSSGVSVLLVAVLMIWAFRAYPRKHLVRRGAILCGIFIVTEALIGASLVLFEHVAQNASMSRAYSLSLHLINTFTLLAVMSLTAWWASTDRGVPLALDPSPSLRWLMFGSLGGLVLLGISGAITALGDTLFPVTSLAVGLRQDFAPGAPIFIRLRIFHPGIAIAAVCLLVFAVAFVMRRIQTAASQGLGLTVIALSLVQLMLGAINLAMLAPVAMQMVHLLFADLLWIAAVLFAARALTVTQSAAGPRPAVLLS